MMRGLWLAFAVLVSTSAAAHAASFDCDLPHLTANERAICDHRDLNDADVEMATLLRFLGGLFAMGTRGNMQDDQAIWLRSRMACGADVPCIRGAYRARLTALNAIYEDIERPL